MNITDYIPHGITVVFASVISYVFKTHTDTDDRRFVEIKRGFDDLTVRTTQIADKMSENHSEILKVLLTAANDRANIASIVQQQQHADDSRA